MKEKYRILFMKAFWTMVWGAASAFLIKNWATFENAPLIFAGSLGIGGLLGWVYARWQSGEQIKTWTVRLGGQDDEIKRKDKEIDELKIKLKGETQKSLHAEGSQTSPDTPKDNNLSESQARLLSSLMKLNSEKVKKKGFLHRLRTLGTKIEEGIYSVSIEELRQELPLRPDEFRDTLDFLIEENLCRLQGGTLRGLAWNEGYKDGERVYITQKGISTMENINKK